ncbi:MAG: META domain-containing protein [Candidatus Igneacidithiobacillus chanchocoensis]
MRRPLPLGFLPLLFLAACAAQPGPSVRVMAQADTNRTSLDWAGAYAGDAPGADTPLIRVTIGLDANGDYQISRQYADRPASSFTEMGTFSWLHDDRDIELRDRQGHTSLYQVRENALMPLDADGKAIPPRGKHDWLLHKISDLPSAAVLFSSFRWQLQSLNGAKSIAEKGRAPYITFLPAEQRMSGYDGCNRIGAAYVLGPQQHLRFRALISTRMACPGVAIDRSFTAALESTASYRVVANELLLQNAAGAVVARLIAVPQPED